MQNQALIDNSIRISTILYYGLKPVADIGGGGGGRGRTHQRNVLFNDVLNTFYLRLYGVRHMVKDHSDSERRNTLPPHRLQGFFYMHHPTDIMTHTSR